MKNVKKITVYAAKVLVVVLLFSTVYRLFCGFGQTKIYSSYGISVYMEDDKYKGDVEKMVRYVGKRITEIDSTFKPNYSIYFCRTLPEFHIKALSVGTPLAVNRVHLKTIIIRPIDLGKEKTIAPRKPVLKGRDVSTVLLHEIMHNYELKKLGVLQFYLKNYKESWKMEGFCDYIAGSSSFPVDKGLRVFLGDDSYDFVTSNEVEPEYFYFVARLRTDYLLQHKRISQDEYWSTKYDEQQLDDEIKSAIKKGYTISQGAVVKKI